MAARHPDMLASHAKVLAAFAFVVTTVVSITHYITAEKISDNQSQDLQQQLSQVLPAASFDNQLITSAMSIEDPEILETRTIYIASLNEKPTAVVITATATDGYVGDINLLVGINRDGSIASVRVTQHSETPGLGDKIEHRRSDWITQFDGKTLQYPITWAVKKDGGEFDQLTGATITPRAVIRAIRRTLEFFDQHQQQFFATP